MGQRVAQNGFLSRPVVRTLLRNVCVQPVQSSCMSPCRTGAGASSRKRSRSLGAVEARQRCKRCLVAQFRKNNAIPCQPAFQVRIPIHHPCKRPSVGGGLANLPAEWDLIAVQPCRKNALDS